MQLHLDKIGFISADYPKTFYRVECWNMGSRIADFTTSGEAASFAIRHAKENGYRYDHKVSKINMTGRP